MATIEFIIEDDLEQFKQELFAELRRPGQKLHKQCEQKEWLKSYEVRELLSISPRALQTLRKALFALANWRFDVLQICRHSIVSRWSAKP